MNIDFKRGFTYLFKEQDWYIKVAIGFALSIAAAVLSLIVGLFIQQYMTSTLNIDLSTQNIKNLHNIVGSIVSLPFNVLIWGYVLNSAHNELHDIQPRLPEWINNLLKYFKVGILSYLIVLLYSAIFLLLPTILLVIAIATHSILFAIIMGITMVVAFIIYLFATIVGNLAFCENFNFKDALNIDKIYKIITKGYPYFILIGIIVMGITIAAYILLAITCIGILLIPAASFIMQLITINLNAQVYKQIKSQIQPV